MFFDYWNQALGLNPLLELIEDFNKIKFKQRVAVDISNRDLSRILDLD